MVIQKLIANTVSNEDTFYNKEKFENKDINLLLVCGIPGSGKTELVNRLAKIPSVEAIELDKVRYAYQKTIDKIKSESILLFDYYSKNPESMKEMERKEWMDTSLDLMKYAIDYSKNHKNKIFIIEGTFASFLFTNETDEELLNSYLDNSAIIIVNTPVNLCKQRAAKRDSEYEYTKEGAKKIADQKKIQESYNNYMIHPMKIYEESIPSINKLKQILKNRGN